MKIVMLIGNAPNQIALVQKVAEHFDIVGVLVETRRVKRGKTSPGKIVEKLLDRTLFMVIRSSWFSMLNHYRVHYGTLPEGLRVAHTENINDPAAEGFIREVRPDLLLVSGTRILRSNIIDLRPSYGILNLHTGLSPYVKGGPNCTNWCMAKRNYHMIGNTIMWLDAGIDSGNIISSAIVELDGSETLKEIHLKVMEEAHRLYLNCLELLVRFPEKCPSVPQESIAEGELFYSKQWGIRWKQALLWTVFSKNLKKEVDSGAYRAKVNGMTTVPLPDTAVATRKKDGQRGK